MTTVAPQPDAIANAELKADTAPKTDANYANCTCGKDTERKEMCVSSRVSRFCEVTAPQPARPAHRAWRPRATTRPQSLHIPRLASRSRRRSHTRRSSRPRQDDVQWLPDLGVRLDWHCVGRRADISQKRDTIYDLFMTTRIPGKHNLRTFTSGSLMRAHMLKIGELNAAADEMDWAASEPDPKRLQPFDIGTLIRDAENRNGGKYDMDSVFNKLLPALQAQLPYHLLPEKLIVHDPWNTLSIRNPQRDADTPWSDKEDIVHTYKLSLSPEGEKKVKEDREAAEKAEAERVEKEKDEWRILNPSRTPDGKMSNNYAVHAKVPSRLPKPTSILEAHLFIRRADRTGTGNHSAVYTVQLELPRWALAEDVLCDTCWWRAFEKEMDERVEADTLLSDEEKAKTPELKVVTKIVDPRAEVVLLEDEPHGKECRDARNGPSDLKYDRGICMERIVQQVQTTEFSGPTAYIYPKVEWQRPGVTPVCEHLRIPGAEEGERPATARVRVCAKMSFQHDAHLAREAANYQQFPSWLFEHWSGYNVVRPLHDPTPCGAVVPQFYGYYVPEKPGNDEDYLSPLLLLEHCGKEIEVEDLSEDERNEAAALYFHFLDAEWTQGSIAPRNVLVQSGPITESPLGRVTTKKKKCFRLIDFGRAMELGDENNRYVCDKDEVFRLFKLAHHAE